MTLSRNWLRQIELTAGSKKFAIPNFEIEFTYNFDLDEEPNQAEIYIKNLKNSTINSYIKKDNSFSINAGYKGNVGTITRGIIIDTSTGWNRTDKDTSITAIDCTQAYLDAFISKAYVPGTTADDIIQDLLKATGLAIGEYKLAKNIQYTKGRLITGKVRNILKEIVVQDCETNLQITNGAIFIRPIEQGLETGFILNKETGLIGSPEKIEDIEDTPDEKKPDYRVKCLLNHLIRPMVRIKVTSTTLNATCVVVKGQHRGSMRGEFLTEMEVKAV